jgi:DNA replication protein DnaC
MAELITERITTNARELKLLGLAETADELVDRAEQAKLGYREFLDLVLESEVGVLEGRRYASRLKLSGLPHHKTLDEFDASFQPELDRLGTLRQKLSHLLRPHLLICDEVGYLPLEPADANRFFQLINRRYTRSSTIVTSNKRVSEWAALLGDEILASAILDRLLHDAEVLTINGPSWRLRGRSEILTAPLPNADQAEHPTTTKTPRRQPHKHPDTT